MTDSVNDQGSLYKGVNMALTKYKHKIGESTHQAFDKEFTPGQSPDWSGIYECTGCGDEIAANKGNPLPPQNHHQHAPGAGPIRWKLLVYAVQK